MPDFKMERRDGSLEGERIVKLTGPFTLEAVFEFQDAIRKDHAPITIVDLTDVPYMDSAALGSLLGLHVSCQRDHRQYALMGVSERLQTLFRVAGVGGMLNIFGSLAGAEAAVAARTASA